MNAADFPRVGLAEAIERLASMPAFVQAALDAASHDELKFSPAESEFSLVEQACHLRDLDQEYLGRVRRVLAEGVPTLVPFDGTRIARERDYLGQDAHAAARAFAASRRELVALLAPLTAGELGREAMFDAKRITLLELIAMIVEHDRGHREEIETLAEALESP